MLKLSRSSSPYASDLLAIKSHSKQVLTGTRAARKRKALRFLVSAGIATSTGRLTAKYRR